MDPQTKPIICTVKPLQYLSIGQTTFSSGCATIDVSFPNMGMVDLGAITFRNNYTAFLTINCKFKKVIKGETRTHWKTGMNRKKLMSLPHCETNSQSFFTVKSSEFSFCPQNVQAVRFVLRQPSPCWKRFSIEEIKLYPPPEPLDSSVIIPRWLQSSDDLRLGLNDEGSPPREKARKEGLPDPEDVAKHLQELWSLTNIAVAAGSAAEGAPVGRFDIDGCYEINLLSYT